MATWMVATKDGKRIGPVSDSQLLAMARSGQIDAETLVRKEGMQGWAKASQVKGLLTPRTPAAAAVPTASARPVPPPVAKPVRSSVAAPAAMAAAYAATPAAATVPEANDSSPDVYAGPMQFKVTPHKPDGAFTTKGLLITLLLILSSGLILGVLAHFIGRIFYLIVLFPILIGTAMGALGGWGIKICKFRNTALPVVLGVLGGVVAVLTIHQLDYMHFRSTVMKAVEQTPGLKEFVLMAPAEREQVLSETGASSDDRKDMALLIKSYNADSLLKYLDVEAEVGVEIAGLRSSSKKGMNLGYTGTWIYWCVELIIVAMMAIGFVSSQASSPFCARCGNWKKRVKLGSFTVTTANAKKAVLSGDFQKWIEAGFTSKKTGLSKVDIAKCANCDGMPFEICLVEFKKGKKENKVKSLAVVTYPPEAEAAIRSLLAAPASAEETPTVVTVS